MKLTPDPWLGEVLERPTWRLQLEAGEPLQPAEVRDAIGGLGPATRSLFCYASLPASDVQAARTLSAAGFYGVAVNVTLTRIPGRLATGDAAITVAPCPVAAADPVLEIASSAFELSRFHSDPGIPRPLADRTRRAWVESYLVGKRGNELQVASQGDRQLGFLAALVQEREGRRVAVIDLIGVHRDARRQGAGAALVRHFVNRWSGEVDELSVGTQVANIASIRLYERHGFRLWKADQVLHYHQGAA